jgi:hypothetical protein
VRIIVAIVVVLALPGPAAAGPDPATRRTADCDDTTPISSPIPEWSRVQWSVGFGASLRHAGGDSGGNWRRTFAVVPQASYALWTRESACAAGSGGWLFTGQAWLRWSLGASIDAVWRDTSVDTIDVRPALRLARSTYERSLLSLGSDWTPTYEVSLTAGPTFDPSWSGVAVSLGGRISIISLELRGALRTDSRGEEVVLLVGLTDLHGLLSLGPART